MCNYQKKVRTSSEPRASSSSVINTTTTTTTTTTNKNNNPALPPPVTLTLTSTGSEAGSIPFLQKTSLPRPASGEGVGDEAGVGGAAAHYTHERAGGGWRMGSAGNGPVNLFVGGGGGGKPPSPPPKSRHHNFDPPPPPAFVSGSLPFCQSNTCSNDRSRKNHKSSGSSSSNSASCKIDAVERPPR